MDALRRNHISDNRRHEMRMTRAACLWVLVLAGCTEYHATSVSGRLTCEKGGDLSGLVTVSPPNGEILSVDVEASGTYAVSFDCPSGEDFEIVAMTPQCAATQLRLPCRSKTVNFSLNERSLIAGIGIKLRDIEPPTIDTVLTCGSAHGLLQPGDIIESADGFIASNKQAAVSKIQGVPGTLVTLRLRRDGREIQLMIPRMLVDPTCGLEERKADAGELR